MVTTMAPFKRKSDVTRRPARYTTRDGRKLTLRLIRPADAPLLEELFYRLSPESRWRRFHALTDGIPPERITEQAGAMADVDNRTLEGAVVAVVKEADGEHIVGVVRLARPARLLGVDLDTSHFTGNFPPAASLEACCLDAGDPEAGTVWEPLLPAQNLGGNRHHYVALDGTRAVSHVRVNLFPDGGLARLRLYGVPAFDAAATDTEGLVDLVAAIQGGTVVAANNEHFGRAANLLLPGRGVNMGDGWETRRRREPGHDWCILALARPGTIAAVEVDTCHFKGNYPDRCSLQAAHAVGGTPESLVTQSMFWPLLLPEQPLQMDRQHHFRSEILPHGPITHVRFNIHPDGGVSRLRLRGRPA